MVPQSSIVFGGMSSFLVVLVMKALIVLLGSFLILFGHLKYGSFLIFSKI